MIETQHHVWLNYTYPEGADADNIENLLFQRCARFGAIELNLFGGNAGCAPYLTFWAKSWNGAALAQHAVIQLLREQGCTVGDPVRRMTCEAHCLYDHNLAELERTGVRVVDEREAPWRVTFEGTESALQAAYATQWQDGDFPGFDEEPAK